MNEVLRGVILMGLAAFFMPWTAQGQEPDRRWQRRVEATQTAQTLFHSTQAINLPTGEMLSRGDWQFEIAHRFFPAVSEGQDALWGLDGPAFMRIGLGYAPSDETLVTLGRSNFLDNWDLQAKVRVLEAETGSLPLQIAVQGGAAWSTQVAEREATDRGNFQYYGQLILNTKIGDRLALGLVSSYVHNVLLDEVDPVQDLFWGGYGQLYLNDILSVLGEWNSGENGADLTHQTGAVGIELETGGHFFKVFFTNSIRLNPSQYLVGSEYPFEPEEWRLGFSITRLLRF
jgi:hypothetical protein